MGPSGSGKSTLLHLLGGLDTASDGEIFLNAGMGVTLLATILPASRALAISPLVALRAAAAEALPWPRRRLLGAGALGLALTGLAPLYLIADLPAACGLVPPWDGALTALFSLGWLLGWAVALPLIFLRGTRRAVLALSHRALPRLMADNLIRAQSRVTLTIFTLSLALLTITAVTPGRPPLTTAVHTLLYLSGQPPRGQSRAMIAAMQQGGIGETAVNRAFDEVELLATLDDLLFQPCVAGISCGEKRSMNFFRLTNRRKP